MMILMILLAVFCYRFCSHNKFCLSVSEFQSGRGHHSPLLEAPEASWTGPVVPSLPGQMSLQPWSGAGQWKTRFWATVTLRTGPCCQCWCVHYCLWRIYGVLRGDCRDIFKCWDHGALWL